MLLFLVHFEVMSARELGRTDITAVRLDAVDGVDGGCMLEQTSCGSDCSSEFCDYAAFPDAHKQSAHGTSSRSVIPTPLFSAVVIADLCQTRHWSAAGHWLEIHVWVSSTPFGFFLLVIAASMWRAARTGVENVSSAREACRGSRKWVSGVSWKSLCFYSEQRIKTRKADIALAEVLERPE